MLRKTNKISCIWIQVISTPRDLNSQKEFVVGSRVILNKKKFPYLYKFGFLRFPRPTGECKLYQDEIEVVVEKKYEEQTQRNIKRISKEKDEKLKNLSSSNDIQ